VKTTITLVRHGQVHNPAQIFYGRLPRFGLSELGRQQAAAAAQALASKDISAIFSSPLLRARQTAQQITAHHPHLTLRTTTLLSEIYTPFDGSPSALVTARNDDIYTGSAPQYEQPAGVYTRIHQFFLRIHNRFAGKHVVGVTHADVIAFAVLGVMGEALTPQNKTKLKPFGICDGFPALASMTTFVFNTTLGKGFPEIQYRSVL